MGAQNVNFALKFPKMEGLRSKFCIFGRKFSDQKKMFRQFSDSPKFRGWGQLSPLAPRATTPANRERYTYSRPNDVYCGVIIKLVLGCFAVLIQTHNRSTYIKLTQVCSLQNNALKAKSRVHGVPFTHTFIILHETRSVCSKFSP